MELSHFVSRLQLDLLSKEWVDKAWKDGFPISLELPPEYELQVECDINDTLTETRKFIVSWLGKEPVRSGRGSSNPKSWNALVHSINHRSLISLLSALIVQYIQDDDDVKLRAILAARLYLCLMSIEGSHIFKVYSLDVYAHVVDILKTVTKLYGSSKISKGGRGRKKKSDENDAGEENAVPELSEEERRKIVSSICTLLGDLTFCVKSYSLDSDPNAISMTVQALIMVAAAERCNGNFLELSPPKGSTALMAQRAYRIIQELCLHGEQDKTLTDVMRGLLPHICTFDSPSWQQGSKELLTVKEHTMKFVINLVQSIKGRCLFRFKALVQQICIRVPDKADVRAKYVQLLFELINYFPVDLYFQTVLWIISLCFAESVKNRLMGLEFVFKILTSSNHESFLRKANCTPPNQNTSEIDPNENNENLDVIPQVGHRYLFAAVLSRCNDLSPRVRTKSLSFLSTLILAREVKVAEIMTELFMNTSEAQDKRDFFDFPSFFSSRNFSEMQDFNPLPSVDVIIELLERFVNNDKVFVRKNSLHAISNICFLNSCYMTSKRLEILVHACKDQSVGNRKMLVQCLTDLLLKYPEFTELHSGWVSGIIPLIAEYEVKCQEKVIEATEMVLLNNIVEYHHISNGSHRLPWLLIEIITKGDMRKLFRSACRIWCINKKISAKLVKRLQTYIGTEFNLAAWFLFSCISEFQDLPNGEVMVDYLYSNVIDSSEVDESCAQLVFSVIQLNLKQLAQQEQQKLAALLSDRIYKFLVPLPLITFAFNIVTLYDQENAVLLARTNIPVTERKVRAVLEHGERELSEVHCKLLPRCIFSLGEMTLLAPGIVTKEFTFLVSQRINIANFDPNRLDEQLSKFGKVHAVIITFLGKICLQNQIKAKDIVPVLGNLVSSKSPSEIKINVNIALADLTIRFSALVEPYFGDMCVCLKDSDPKVRKNILTLISMLVQEDFLKLKAPVLIYLLSMLQDSCDEIREFASSFIVNSLLRKIPSLMCQHIVQTILFLNSYESSSSIASKVSPQEKHAFCMTGITNTANRRHIYQFMLENTPDVDKIRVTFRICTDILDHFCEDKIKLEGEGVSILKDALFVLSCDEMRSSLGSGQVGQEEEDEDIEPVTVSKMIVINKLVSNIQKTNLTEYIIPIIIKLKHKLRSLKSPLVRDLMICLKEILRGHSEQEIGEILAADPELAAEVAQDLKQVEQDKRNTEQQSLDDSPQDTLVAEMRRVAHRISEGVIRLGPEFISSEDSTDSRNGSMTPKHPLRSSRSSQESESSESCVSMNGTTRRQGRSRGARGSASPEPSGVLSLTNGHDTGYMNGVGCVSAHMLPLVRLTELSEQDLMSSPSSVCSSLSASSSSTASQSNSTHSKRSARSSNPRRSSKS